MTYSASNRKDIRRAEKAAALDEAARIEFVVAAMSTIQGRAWFYDHLVKCHIFSDPFTGEPLREAYSKGERNIGLEVYNQIVTNCPDDFVQMMKEAKQKEILDGQRRANERAYDSGDDSDDDDGDATGSEHTRSSNGNGRAQGSVLDDIYGIQG